MRRRIPLVAGTVYGRLTVISEVPPKNNGKFERRVRCRCICGTEIITSFRRLRSGECKSCGCLNRELITTLGRGSREFPATTQELWERIRAKCVWIGDCFVWQGKAKHPRSGHGRLTVRKGKTRYVHQIAYEYVHGPVPAGMELDHVKSRGCRFGACCNVAHLEVVTHVENVLRGNGWAGRNARKTHCIHGHPLWGSNLTIRKRGSRECRQCTRDQARARRLKKAIRDAV